MTLTPALMASSASATAYWPGTDTKARLAPPASMAPPRVRRGGASPKPPDWVAAERSPASASVSAACPDAIPSSLPRSAMIRSFGAVAGSVKPMERMTSRLSSVAIATWAASTPGAAATARETCIRLTES